MDWHPFDDGFGEACGLLVVVDGGAVGERVELLGGAFDDAWVVVANADTEVLTEGVNVLFVGVVPQIDTFPSLQDNGCIIRFKRFDRRGHVVLAVVQDGLASYVAVHYHCVLWVVSKCVVWIIITLPLRPIICKVGVCN